jgi:ABC-2 type transport system permease protein
MLARTGLAYLRMLGVFYRTSIQADMEYRVDFFARVIASLLGLLTTVGSLSIAYGYTDNLRGWTFAQAMVLLSVYYLMDGLVEMFIGPNMRQIASQVREGTLDFILMKPVNSQFMASFRLLNVWRAANALVGLGLSVYTISRLSISMGPIQALAFALTVLVGLSIIYAFWLILVTLTFWFVRVDNIEQIVWQAFEAARYPIEIYPAWLRSTLTYLVPVVFIVTVPASALAGRLSGTTLLAALAVGAALLIGASAFWRFGLRSYTGASA